MSKVISFLILMLFVIGGCKKDKLDEVPSGIIRTVANPTLYPRIVSLFPAHQNAEIEYPELFSDAVQKNIILTDSSEVYVTFIAEDAKYRNSLGWYSYTKGNEPKTKTDLDLHLLFPNISAKGEGGELLQGDMLQVGNKKFPKNTVIGFFLVLDGWKDGTIDYGLETHYTDYILNTNGHQKHILFKEKNSGDIILGFEDLPDGDVDLDSDYNDILVTIQDNKDGYESIFIDTTKMTKL
jgi:hypothetical protein